jgi:prevent-host-death family protein
MDPTRLTEIADGVIFAIDGSIHQSLPTNRFRREGAPKMKKITATDARVRFGKMLRQVAEEGETVLVERGGQPQVVVMSLGEYDRLSSLEDRQPPWQLLLDEILEEVDRERAGAPLPPAEELIREMREERDAELLGLR